MNILVLGGDGYLGWPTALYLSRRGHRVGVVDNFARRGYDLEMGVDSLVPIVSLQQPGPPLEGDLRHRMDVFVGDLTDPDFVSETLAAFRARRRGPLRRAAVRPVLDDRPQARGLHPGQQRGRHAQPALRHRRAGPGHPPGQAGHDGRVRHAQHRHRRGLHRDHPPGPHRRAALPEAARLLLPPVQGARQRTTSCSPAASGASGPPTSTRASSTATRPRRPPSTPTWPPGSTTTAVFGTVLNRFCVQAVTGHPLTVYGSGRPDPGHAQHPRHPGLRRAGLREPGRPRRVPGVQPVHRVLLGGGDGRHGGRPSSPATPPSSTRRPPGGEGGALLPGGPHQAARPRPGAPPPHLVGDPVASWPWPSSTRTTSTRGHPAHRRVARARPATWPPRVPRPPPPAGR